MLTAHQRKDMPIDLLADPIGLLRRQLSFDARDELGRGIDVSVRNGDMDVVDVDVDLDLLLVCVAERVLRAHLASDSREDVYRRRRVSSSRIRLGQRWSSPEPRTRLRMKDKGWR